MVPAKATPSPGPSPRSPTYEPRSALPLSLGISMSPSASSAQSASSPCGPCATRSSPGRTPPATRRARSTTRWPPCSLGSVRTAPGSEGSSISPYSWRRKPADLSAGCRSFPAVSRNERFANVLYIVGEPTKGHAEGLRQIELAEESGNRSRLVHACYMGAVGHSSDGAYDEADALVARAHQLAKQTASPTDLASVEVARGFASRTEDEASGGVHRRRPDRPQLPATAGCTGSPSPRRAGYSSLEVSSRPGARVWPTWSESGTAPGTGHSSGTRCRAV